MSAQKDRLIQAAELLDLDPDELLSLLDQRKPTPYPTPPAEFLHMIRPLVDIIAAPGRLHPDDARTLARLVRELDLHLCAGGRLPEAWAPAAFAEREAARAEAVAGHLPTDVPGEEPTHAGCIIGTRGASHTAGCPSSFPFGSAWDDES